MPQSAQNPLSIGKPFETFPESASEAVNPISPNTIQAEIKENKFDDLESMIENLYDPEDTGS